MLPPSDRRKRIFSLALPIMGGMVSQNVMNLVDTAMVGRLGKADLAAVGMASFATFLSQAFLLGLSSGVQAMAARRKGEGKVDEMAVPLNGGLLLACVLGVPLGAVLFFLAPTLFPFLNGDPHVVEAGVPYWQVRLLAVPAVACNFCFRGYWNGTDLSRLYLRTLVQMHVINLFLNYVLIFGELGFPALGSTGAAIGTSVSTYVGTLTYVMLGLRFARGAGFLRRLPDALQLKTIVRLSVPNGIQQVFFAGSMVCLTAFIGMVGTAELAAANVLINLMLVGVLPGMGLGLAAASLVGQALGHGDQDDARQWGWDVVRVGVAVLLVLALPMIALPHVILPLFLGDDLHVIEIATQPMRIMGFALVFDAAGLVLMNALLGAGDARRVAMVSTGFQWLVLLPLVYLVGPALGYGLVAIFLVQAGVRIAQSFTFVLLWRGTGWQSLKV